MRPSYIVHASAALILISLAATAGAADDPVSPDVVVASAITNDPEAVALREELEVRKSYVVRASTLRNPVMEGEIATGSLTGSPDEARYGIGISQEVPLWGKRGRRVEAADAALREALARLHARERVVAAEVRTRSVDLLLIRERQRIAGEAAQLAKGLRQVADARFAEGDIPEFEVNMAKAEEAAAENRRRDAVRMEDAARRELLLFAGLPENTVLQIHYRQPPFCQERELVPAALAGRPDLLAAQAEKERAEAELTLARKESLPDLTAALSVQHESSATAVNGRNYRDSATLLGVRFSIPLPVFDTNAASIREAAARVRGAEERKRLLRARAEGEVAAACREKETAAASLEFFDKNVLPPLGENASVVREAYQLGETGISQVIQEQRKLLEAMETRQLLLKAVREAEARLETATGVPVAFEGGEK